MIKNKEIVSMPPTFLALEKQVNGLDINRDEE